MRYFLCVVAQIIIVELMPLPALLAAGSLLWPAVGAGLSAGGGLLASRRNARMQSEQNALDRQFQLDMYNRQRGHALDDWNMQNEYNSPRAMMQRYKEAGLNPHLIYGNQGSTPSVRSSSAGTGAMPAPKVDYSAIAQGLSAFFSIMQTQAQTDNIRASKELIDAQTGKVQNETALGELALKRGLATYDDDVRHAFLENRGMYIQQQDMLAERALKASDFELRHIASQDNHAKAILDMAESKLDMAIKRQQIDRNSLVVQQLEQALKLAKQDEKLGDIEIDIKEFERDNNVYRLLLEVLGKLGINISSLRRKR